MSCDIILLFKKSHVGRPIHLKINLVSLKLNIPFPITIWWCFLCEYLTNILQDALCHLYSQQWHLTKLLQNDSNTRNISINSTLIYSLVLHNTPHGLHAILITSLRMILGILLVHLYRAWLPRQDLKINVAVQISFTGPCIFEWL